MGATWPVERGHGTWSCPPGGCRWCTVDNNPHKPPKWYHTMATHQEWRHIWPLCISLPPQFLATQEWDQPSECPKRRWKHLADHLEDISVAKDYIFHVEVGLKLHCSKNKPVSEGLTSLDDMPSMWRHGDKGTHVDGMFMDEANMVTSIWFEFGWCRGFFSGGVAQKMEPGYRREQIQ